jgi:hypothetical protein
MGKLIGAMTTADGAAYFKCGLFFSDTDLTPVPLGNTDLNLADENYLTWERVVESVNTNKTSLVDYKIKAVPELDTNEPTKAIQYADIKSVKISKAADTGSDPRYDQYVIDFSTGIFSYTPYVIPAATLNEAVTLIKKTSLASKLTLPSTDPSQTEEE